MKKIFALLAVVFCLAACSSQKEDTIRIATKPMAEQFILAEMLGLLIEQHGDGLKVEIKKGIGGGTANIHPAIVKGEFDLYPEYTGTAWLYVLKKQPMTDDAALFAQLNAAYQQDFGLEWVGQYGFNNTYEPPRDCRRLQNLREWSHEKQQEIQCRGSRTGGSARPGAAGGLFLTLGSSLLHCRQDRLHC